MSCHEGMAVPEVGAGLWLHLPQLLCATPLPWLIHGSLALGSGHACCIQPERPKLPHTALSSPQAASALPPIPGSPASSVGVGSLGAVGVGGASSTSASSAPGAAPGDGEERSVGGSHGVAVLVAVVLPVHPAAPMENPVFDSSSQVGWLAH